MMDKSAIQAMLAEALDKGDTSKADKLLLLSFEQINRELVEIANDRMGVELPLVAAAMILTANTLKSVMPEGGAELTDQIVGGVRTVAINVSELLRQSSEEEHGEPEEL